MPLPWNDIEIGAVGDRVEISIYGCAITMRTTADPTQARAIAQALINAAADAEKEGESEADYADMR